MTTKCLARSQLAQPVWSLIFALSLAFVTIQAAALDENGHRISQADLKPTPSGMPGELSFQRMISVAAGFEMLARIEITSKGNGILGIANLRLKVFDSHDDGTYFENGLLNIDFKDIDGDGKREMIISGIVCITDENGKVPLRREPVVFIYKLDANLAFKAVYRSGKVVLDGY
jgi:hypothetical protein